MARDVILGFVVFCAVLWAFTGAKEIEINLPASYSYQRITEFDVSPERQSIVFSVQMSSDFHIALTRYMDVYRPGTIYEIVIGGWSNSRSVIRHEMQGSIELAKADTPNILDVNNFRSFWISWEGGVIRVGKGDAVGQNVFMQYVDPISCSVNYVAVSGKTAAGTVKISYSTTTVYDLINIDVAGIYEYHRVVDLDVSAKQSVLFSAKMSTDLHIALTRDADIYDPDTMYEIVIGGWKNTVSVIRRKKQGIALANSSTPNILEATIYRSFWISWNAGVIRVGQGNIVGQKVFMTYADASPITVKYFALSGLSAPGAVTVNYQSKLISTKSGSGLNIVSPNLVMLKQDLAISFVLTPCLALSKVDTDRAKHCVSLMPEDVSGWYVRHYAFYAYVESSENPRNPSFFDVDASFILHEEPVGSGFYTFESVNYPGYFIMAMSDNRLKVTKREDSTVFQDNIRFMLNDTN